MPNNGMLSAEMETDINGKMITVMLCKDLAAPRAKDSQRSGFARDSDVAIDHETSISSIYPVSFNEFAADGNDFSDARVLFLSL